MTKPPPYESKVESLLGRFPGPVTLSGEQSDDPTLLLASLLFVALFACLTPLFNGLELVLWCGFIGLWCPVIVLGAFQALSKSAGLTLDAEGFRQRISLVHTQALWKDVDDFKVAEINSPFSRGKTGDVIWYHDKIRENWRPHRVWKARANAGINPVQELSMEQLIDLPKCWREKALAQKTEASQS